MVVFKLNLIYVKWINERGILGIFVAIINFYIEMQLFLLKHPCHILHHLSPNIIKKMY